MSSTRLGLVAVFVSLALGYGVAAPPARTTGASDTDWKLYGAQLRSAHRAWQLGNVADAWRELEACRWDLRGWEHRHLCALLMRKQAILTRDGSHAEFTQDGRLQVRDEQGVRRLRDERTFEPIEGTAQASDLVKEGIPAWH